MTIEQVPAIADRGDAVCVIGAGAAGLTTVKNLREQGFAVDCYERETDVAGAWNWRHDRSPVYASTHLISSRPMSQFPDFPMPDDWPDYPHHSLVRDYLERYADHFDLRRDVWLGTEVTWAAPTSDGRWDVTTSTVGAAQRRVTRYAAVVIANGHNWSPKLPSYPGQDTFAGTVLHASEYKDAAVLRGRRVLVVGGGNSGCDIAVEAGNVADICWHSTRRGYWYAPKYLLGRPVDQVNDGLRRLPAPAWLRQRLAGLMLRLAVGDLTRFGLAHPDHRPLQSHPIVNSQLLHQIGHGEIAPVGEIARFDRRVVVLADGREIDPDLVVFATGYHPTVEFVSPGLLGATSDGQSRLLLHTFAPDQPGLAMVGQLQSDSGVFPLMHWQAYAVGRWLRLHRDDPVAAQRVAGRLRELAARRLADRRMASTPRHWYEVDHVTYLRSLQRLIDAMEGDR